jgi:hypothetical protein
MKYIRNNKKFCSYKCAGIYKPNYEVCPICGKTFKHSPSDVTTKTCGSKECRLKCRDKDIIRNNIKYAHMKIKSSPNTGHFETHHAAEEWNIISPQNIEYKFKNLVLWAEQNASLLPISPRTKEKVKPKTFVREIVRLKSDTNKNTNYKQNYHGWRIKNKDTEN